MKSATINTLSTIATRRQPAQRTTRQTLQTLNFIHRFHHVTAKHIQTSLQHSTLNHTHKSLALLCAKGYLARQYDPQDRSANRAASYYLTHKGLEVL